MLSWLLFFQLCLGQVQADESASTLQNAQYGISIEAPSGWQTQPDPDDATVAFRLVEAGETPDAMMTLRVNDTNLKDLQAQWRALRYAVIAELGGDILLDKPYNVEGAAGRIMMYDAVAPSTQKRRSFLRVYLLQNGRLYTFHAVCAPERASQLFPEFQRTLHTLRFATE